jgi:hypothetical protein
MIHSRIYRPRKNWSLLKGYGLPRRSERYSGLAIGVDRSEEAFRGFLSRKTTPRELFGTTVIAKPL